MNNLSLQKEKERAMVSISNAVLHYLRSVSKITGNECGFDTKMIVKKTIKFLDKIVKNGYKKSDKK